MNAHFNSKKETILLKYEAIIKDQAKVDLVKNTLSPCISAKPIGANSSNKNSKIGGYPLVPKNFKMPLWEEQKLIFLCQIDFQELKAQNIESKLPEKGILSIFAYLKNEGNLLTIPAQNKNQLKGFYFKETEALEPLMDDAITIENLNEVKIDFGLYGDIPEFGDYRFPAEWINIDPDMELRYNIIPKIFGEEEIPMMKILGYPTDDALSTYFEWYIMDNNLQDANADAYMKQYEAEKSQYELLLSVSLLEIGSLKLEDEYADFGGISIGIRKVDLENAHFDNLLFKYTIS